MEFIKAGININFIGKRHLAFSLSLIAILVGVVSLILRGGPNYGIDFRGGTIVQLLFSKPTSPEEIREGLKQIGLGNSLIQQFGEKGNNEYIIRLERSESGLKGLGEQIREALEKHYGKGAFELRRVEMVGPKVGKDLRRKGMLSIIYAMIGILIYISWRFELKFALGAIIALLHDVMITLGAFSITDKEITLPIVAALLAIVGYSLNDTIVVYDRIRENLRRYRKQRYESVVNSSINEVLSRTILTSLTTLLVVTALFVFGGGVIHNFAFALLVGIVAGTYSSVFVASSFVIFWQNRFLKKAR